MRAGRILEDNPAGCAAHSFAIVGRNLHMRTATVSLPDEVYERARIAAANQGRSVGELVAEVLSEPAEPARDFGRLEALQQRVQAEITGFRAGDRLERDRLYDRT